MTDASILNNGSYGVIAAGTMNVTRGEYTGNGNCGICAGHDGLSATGTIKDVNIHDNIGGYRTYAKSDITLSGDNIITGSTKFGGIQTDAGSTTTISVGGTTEVSGNTRSGNNGGGVLNDGTLKVNGTLNVRENSATGNGGGIYNTGTVDALTTGSQLNIMSNYAGGNGGGIYSTAGTVSLGEGTYIDSNVIAKTLSESAGAGIYNGGTSNLVTNYPIITNNGHASGVTNKGGAIANVDSATATINGLILGGHGATYGKGIYSGGGTITMSGNNYFDSTPTNMQDVYILEGHPITISTLGSRSSGVFYNFTPSAFTEGFVVANVNKDNGKATDYLFGGTYSDKKNRHKVYGLNDPTSSNTAKRGLFASDLWDNKTTDYQIILSNQDHAPKMTTEDFYTVEYNSESTDNQEITNNFLLNGIKSIEDEEDGIIDKTDSKRVKITSGIDSIKTKYKNAQYDVAGNGSDIAGKIRVDYSVEDSFGNVTNGTAYLIVAKRMTNDGDEKRDSGYTRYIDQNHLNSLDSDSTWKTDATKSSELNSALNKNPDNVTGHVLTESDK